METTEVETIGLHDTGFKLTMRDNCKPKVNTYKEMYLLLDTIHLPYAESADI